MKNIIKLNSYVRLLVLIIFYLHGMKTSDFDNIKEKIICNGDSYNQLQEMQMSQCVQQPLQLSPPLKRPPAIIFDPILCLYMITFVTAFTLLLYDNK